jgi:hypothetical protein
VRCTVQDANIAAFGSDPDTGFARRPHSTEGLQYGLEAFEAGIIDAEEFVTLNEEIGGYDIDGNRVPERSTVDDETVARLYELGAVLGPGALRDVPIILRNPDTDAIGDIHTRYYAFAIRERLQEEGRDAPNLVLWTSPLFGTDPVDLLTGRVAGEDPITVLDEWVTTGEPPPAAVNRCELANGQVVEGGWEIYDDAGRCRSRYPVFGDPRTAAGAPTAGDIVACTLGPIDEVDAELDLSEEHLERLAAPFPDGVCDWTQPGRGQGAPAGTWPDLGPT